MEEERETEIRAVEDAMRDPGAGRTVSRSRSARNAGTLSHDGNCRRMSSRTQRRAHLCGPPPDCRPIPVAGSVDGAPCIAPIQALVGMLALDDVMKLAPAK